MRSEFAKRKLEGVSQQLHCPYLFIYFEDQKELPCIREGEKRNYWPYMLGNINLTSCN